MTRVRSHLRTRSTRTRCRSAHARLIAGLALAIGISSFVQIAAAYTQTAGDEMAESIGSLVARLDSEDWRERNTSAQEIRQYRGLDEEALFRRLLDDEPLSPEQHDRLLSILEERSLRNAGVIGITLDQVRMPVGVRVASVKEQRTWSNDLKPGDILLTIGDFLMSGIDAGLTFDVALDGLEAGQRIDLAIVRDGIPMLIETECPATAGDSGITVLTQDRPVGIEVGDVKPEAPSSEVLEPGDMLLTINGHPLQGRDPGRQLQFAVAATRAGDPLEIDLLRGTALLHVKTEFADPEQIPGFFSMQLQLTRIEQWNAVCNAVRKQPIVLPVVDEEGNALGVFDAMYSRSLEDVFPGGPGATRRRDNTLRNEIRNRLEYLHGRRDFTESLIEVVPHDTVRRALVDRLQRIDEEIDITQRDLEMYDEARPRSGESTEAESIQ